MSIEPIEEDVGRRVVVARPLPGATVGGRVGTLKSFNQWHCHVRFDAEQADRTFNGTELDWSEAPYPAVVIGMNNPQGEQPLWPDPPGCTGHRLWKLLQSKMPEVGRREYLRGFDRRNVLRAATEWDADAAARVGKGVLTEALATGTRRVVVLGQETREALGLPDVSWLKWYSFKTHCAEAYLDRLADMQEREGAMWCLLPHPSGLNRWYNDATNAEAAALLLEELYRETHA